MLTGPVVYTYFENGTLVHRVIGLVSFGFECATPFKPGYYASVYPQLEWVKHVIKETNKCANLDSSYKNGLARCSAMNRKKASFNLQICLLFFICCETFLLNFIFEI